MRRAHKAACRARIAADDRESSMLICIALKSLLTSGGGGAMLPVMGKDAQTLDRMTVEYLPLLPLEVLR